MASDDSPHPFKNDEDTLKGEEEHDAPVEASAHGHARQLVECTGGNERAEDHAYSAAYPLPGIPSEDEEGLPQKLMPTLRPELMKARGRPWSINNRRP